MPEVAFAVCDALHIASLRVSIVNDISKYVTHI